MSSKYSTVAIIGGLTACLLFALMAILFLGVSSESMQRLALFFGVLGLAVPALVSMLRSDQGAKQTNGSLDARIEAGVHRAMSARRRSDGVPPEAQAPASSPIEPEG